MKLKPFQRVKVQPKGFSIMHSGNCFSLGNGPRLCIGVCAVILLVIVDEVLHVHQAL